MTEFKNYLEREIDALEGGQSGASGALHWNVVAILEDETAYQALVGDFVTVLAEDVVVTAPAAPAEGDTFAVAGTSTVVGAAQGGGDVALNGTVQFTYLGENVGGWMGALQFVVGNTTEFSNPSNIQEVVDQLVSLGLATQAAP